MGQALNRAMGNRAKEHTRPGITVGLGQRSAIDETKTHGSDKRKHPRDPAYDLSEIILDGRTLGISCLIHDISPTGARLEVSCGELPKRFILANYTKKTKTLCRQIWRDKRLIGVKFLTSPRPFVIK